MALVLDSEALIAFERGDRATAAFVEAARRRGERIETSSGCVAQAWRDDGGRQVLLARLLRGVNERPLGPEQSRAVGVLCGRAHTRDVVDAHVARLARDGDTVLTSDPDDLRPLVRAAGSRAVVRRC